MNEFPYYIICQKCLNPPKIEIKDNETILIFCDKCNIQFNEKIENVVNYSSKFVSNVIKYCQGEHAEIRPSSIYCKIHNIFLCKDCFLNHQELHNIISNQKYNDNMINISFKMSNGLFFSCNAFDEMPTNELFKLFMKRFDISKNEIDKN